MLIVIGIVIGVFVTYTVDYIMRRMYMDEIVCPYCKKEFGFQVHGKFHSYYLDNEGKSDE